MSSVRTLVAAFTHNPPPVRGSRFVATVAPAADEPAAMAVVEQVAAQHPHASHCCWAWRLQDGRSRTWDAGEPRGSAGRPILLQLQGHDLVDVVAVVVRYFGGTKLGVGGLIRAYGGAAGMALDRAPVVEHVRSIELEVEHDYSDTAAIEAALSSAPVLHQEVAYDTRVMRRIVVPSAHEDEVLAAIRDRTAGRIQAQRRMVPKPT